MSRSVNTSPFKMCQIVHTDALMFENEAPAVTSQMESAAFFINILFESHYPAGFSLENSPSE